MRAIMLAVVCFSGVVAAAHLGSLALFAAASGLSAIVGVWLVRSRRLSWFDLLIVAVPTYFYPPVPGKFIASLADPVLLVLAAPLLLAARGRTGTGTGTARSNGLRLVGGWTFLVQVVAWSSLVWPLLFLRGASLTSGATAAAKLALMAMFVVVAFDEGLRQVRRGDLRFLDVWANTAAAVALVALAGLLLFSQGIDVGLNYDLRATGTFSDPNAFGTYLLLSVGIVMAASYRRRRSALSWHLVPLAAAILLTGSRATFLALVLAVAVTAVVGGSRGVGMRFRVAVAAALAAGGVLLAALPRSVTGPSLQRALGVLQWENPDENRFHLWRMALQMWGEQPVLGVGLGQFRTASGTLLATPTDFVPHSTYLGLLAEVGLVGLLVVMSLPLLVAAGLLAARMGGHSFATFFLFSVVSFGVMAATLNLENFRPFWVFTGLALAMVVGSRSGAETGAGAVAVAVAVDRTDRTDRHHERHTAPGDRDPAAAPAAVSDRRASTWT